VLSVHIACLYQHVLRRQREEWDNGRECVRPAYSETLDGRGLVTDSKLLTVIDCLTWTITHFNLVSRIRTSGALPPRRYGMFLKHRAKFD
jgi:hypothetical protein